MYIRVNHFAGNYITIDTSSHHQEERIVGGESINIIFHHKKTHHNKGIQVSTFSISVGNDNDTTRHGHWSLVEYPEGIRPAVLEALQHRLADREEVLLQTRRTRTGTVVLRDEVLV